ncbi:hypothetical protein Trydic_g21261 [Trypoxylus dichotomus]
MSKRNAQRKISQTQLYPLAFNPSDSPSSWVSLKYDKSTGNNVDYLIVHKHKSKTSFRKIFWSIFQHTILWNAIAATVILGSYLLTSMAYIYEEPANPYGWEFFVSLVCDAVYALDIICTLFLRAIMLVQSNVLDEPKHMGYIVIDCVLAVPYATGYFLIFKDSTSRLLLLLRLITWLRLYRLVDFFTCYESTIQNYRWTLFYIKFTLYFVILQHCFSCVWYGLLKFSPTERTWSDTIANFTSSSKPLSQRYFISSYFSIIILTQTGFGDFTPVNMQERILAIFEMSLGIFLWSYYASNLTILFLRSKYPKYKIQKQLVLITNGLGLIGAERELYRKCIKYYEMFWHKQRGVLSSKKILDLPSMMTVHMNQKSCSFILKYSIIFNDKPSAFLRNICRYIRHEFYLPGQNVYDEKKVKGKMIIIKSGTVDILSEEDNETPIISLGPGTCLGEAALIINLPSNVSVRAGSYMEVYAIHTRDFCKTVTSYPDFYTDIRRAIVARINKRLLATTKNRTNWRDLKQILRDKENLSAISNPIITRYISLYKIALPPKSRSLISEKRRRFSFIRSEDSTSILIWELFIVACAVYVAIVYPYFATFGQHSSALFSNVSNIIHVIFVFDILVLLTTSVTKEGKRVDTLRGIFNERMDTFSFHLDVIACFYLEIYSSLLEDEERFYNLLKLNRVLKMVRISTLCDRLGSKLTTNSVKITCVKYCTYMFFFLYWSSLLLYIQTCFYAACLYNGWFVIKLKNDVNYRQILGNTFGKLIISIYYGLSNTLAFGVGDILPANAQDKLFSMFVVILGNILFGYWLAEITTLQILHLTSRNRFKDLMQAVQFYSSRRSFPHKLERRVKTYFKIQWKYNEAHSILTKKPLMSNLPSHLRHEVLVKEKLATLKKFVIFDEMDDEFLNYLLDNSSTLVLGPNEIVTYFGSINREMYFIYKGLCLKQTENNTYETIGAGSAIGFSSLLFGLPSLNNVCTLTHCILIHINVQTFNTALQQTPLLYRTVYKTRQLILAKYQSNYEVKMIENPHYTKRKKKLRIKSKKLNERMLRNKSFVNAYKYCISNKESYSKLSNTAGKICFLKYLLMPITILPYGPFLKFWYFIRLAITLSLYFVIPLEYMFSPYRGEMHYLRFILEIVVYIDMYLTFHIAFYGSKNQLIIHPWTTAEHYLKGQFIVDVLIWFPYPFLLLLLYNHTEGHSEFAHSISPHMFHCGAHLIKILDIYRVFCAIHYFGQRWNTYWLFRCFKYTFFTILLVHSWAMVLIISTCRYLHHNDVLEYIVHNVTKIPEMIPMPNAKFNLYCYEDSWLNRSVCGNYSMVHQVYFTSVYFVFQTMTGMGFGDIYAESEAEIIIVISILLTGLAFYGYLLTDIISMSTKYRHTLLMYESKFLHLITYMKQEKVNHVLKLRIQDYLQYKWNRTRNVSLQFLLSQMNSTLHEDAALFLYESTLRHVPMFENVDHSFFRVIGKELREEYYLEGDVVIHVNDIVQDIYIIHRGSVELSSAHNMIPIIMGIGGVFGNVFEKDKTLCAISVRALRNLDLLCLSVEKFKRILRDYPFIQKKLNVFQKTEKQKHYAIPNSFVDDGNVYLNPNMYWNTKRSSTVKKKSFFYNCRNIFSHESRRFNIFSCFLLFATYTNFVLTTYQFCFQRYCNALLTCAVIVDVIFLLKFCLEINTPLTVPAGLLNKRSFFAKCMRRRWRRTLDFLANLPIGYSILFLPFITSEYANFYFSIYRLLTLLRMYYMFQFFLVHKEKLMAQRFLLELSVFLIFSTIFCHLLACLWYLMICPWNRCANPVWQKLFATHRPEELYVLSLYLVINTITCTGIGDIVPQTTAQMCVVILYMGLAKIFLGYFISQLIRMLQCGNVWLVKYETIMEHLKSYYTNMSANSWQIGYMINYMSSLWQKRNGLQRYELIAELPRTLRIDLMTSIYGRLIKDSYIFGRTERDFIRQLCLQLKHHTYFPGDYIVRDGDVDSCMYFIYRGDVQILTDGQTVNETVHEVLHKNEVFGIVQGLFKEIPHHFSFRASTIVDLAILNLNEWEYLLDFFPKSKDVIYQRVEEIYYTI